MCALSVFFQVNYEWELQANDVIYFRRLVGSTTGSDGNASGSAGRRSQCSDYDDELALSEPSSSRHGSSISGSLHGSGDALDTSAHRTGGRGEGSSGGEGAGENSGSAGEQGDDNGDNLGAPFLAPDHLFDGLTFDEAGTALDDDDILAPFAPVDLHPTRSSLARLPSVERWPLVFQPTVMIDANDAAAAEATHEATNSSSSSENGNATPPEM